MSPRRWYQLAALIVLVWVVIAYTAIRSKEPAYPLFVVVLTAFHAEAEPLIAAMHEPQEVYGQTPPYTRGWLNGIEIVVIETRSGMVNAAASAQYALDKFPVTHLIFSGIAGSLDPEILPGTVVVPDHWINHQYEKVTDSGSGTLMLDLPSMAATQVYWERFDNAIPVDGQLIRLVKQTDDVIVGGTGLSGDTFVASAALAADLHTHYGASIVDMESAAVAQVALINEVPFVAVRAVSDAASDGAQAEIAANLRVATKAAAQVTLEIIAGLVYERSAAGNF